MTKVLKRINQEELNELLAQQNLWTDPNGKGGKRLELENCDLSYLKICNADLSYVDINNCDLTDMTFDNVLFSNSFIENSNFSHSSFNNVEFLNTSVKDCKFNYSKCYFIYFNEGTDFTNCNLKSAWFSKVLVYQTNFNSCEI